MPSYNDVLYERDGHVAIVTLNRPRYRNAQSRRLLEELDDAFTTADRDQDVRVLVLAGAGDHFSAGHDLGTPEELADREARPIQEGVRGRFDRSAEIFVDFTLRWRDFSKPAVAAVQGYCIYGGWMIASACDILFASEDARFLPSNLQYFSVPWDIHHRKAKALLFEPRIIDAHEAAEYGFVERVFPREQLLAETLAYAQRVAENDPFQMRMTKAAINQALDAQGFTGHIRAAHAFHILSSQGEKDPGYALQQTGMRRRPMVQRAFENYERTRGSE